MRSTVGILCWRRTFSDEANGVNVTATMKKIGIELEWPPREYAYQVAVLGRKKRTL